MNDLILLVILSIAVYVIVVMQHLWRYRKKVHAGDFNYLEKIMRLLAVDVGIGLVLVFGASIIAPNHPFTWDEQNLSLVNPDVEQNKQHSYLFITDEATQTIYTYWYRDQNSVKLGQLTNGDNVVVIQDFSSSDPRLVKVYSMNGYCGDWNLSSFFVTFCGVKNRSNGQRWEFHVPPGTVAYVPLR